MHDADFAAIRSIRSRRWKYSILSEFIIAPKSMKRWGNIDGFIDPAR